jgi:hypothetical protein
VRTVNTVLLGVGIYIVVAAVILATAVEYTYPGKEQPDKVSARYGHAYWWPIRCVQMSIVCLAAAFYVAADGAIYVWRWGWRQARRVRGAE